MKILVYDDNLEFGGHQIMACRGIEALASEPAVEVCVIYNRENMQLEKRIRQIPDIERRHAAQKLARQFKSVKPDIILCIQGDTLQSTRGIDAARRLGVRCISYIAITHPMSRTGAKLGNLRDKLNKHQLNRADEYITISESMKSMLIDRKTRIPVHVVHNGIPQPPIPIIKLPKKKLTLGVIGRIEFKQKQQDFMVRAFQEQAELLKSFNLLFAGNGPDKRRLERMIRDLPNISRIPWMNDIESFYDQIDILIIPSRYEGVPLVLLEALARGIPVIASATDGMQEILPGSWTFDAESTASMAWSLKEVRQSWQTRLEALQQKIITDYSLEQFNRNFVKAVTGT